MGWFGDWWNRDDPRRAVEIDRSLEDFLRREKPSGYQPGAEKSSPAAGPAESYRDQVRWPRRTGSETTARQSENQTPSTDSSPSEKPVPAESLFQDGRYKHLWATYRPLKDVEAATKSDDDRLSDIARAWRQRGADIGRAASENCAEESLAVHDCFRNGGWKAKMSMCRDENKALTRCVTMQRQFLNALGYMTIWDRSPEEAEKIQVHADKLYRRMLEHERLLAEAKDRGEPPPQLPSILDDQAVQSKSLGYKFKWDDLPEEFKEKTMEGRLKGLEGPALEVAKRAIVADVERSADAVWQTNDHYALERRHRIERYLEGTESFGDRLRRWWDTSYGDRPFPAKPTGQPGGNTGASAEKKE